jgi:hypothetical protein
MTVDFLALLGAREEALDVIEAMVESEVPDLSTLNTMLVTERLRGEPRFEAALATLNIPDPPPAAEAVTW